MQEAFLTWPFHTILNLDPCGHKLHLTEYSLSQPQFSHVFILWQLISLNSNIVKTPIFQNWNIVKTPIFQEHKFIRQPYEKILLLRVILIFTSPFYEVNSVTRKLQLLFFRVCNTPFSKQVPLNVELSKNNVQGPRNCYGVISSAKNRYVEPFLEGNKNQASVDDSIPHDSCSDHPAPMLQNSLLFGRNYSSNHWACLREASNRHKESTQQLELAVEAHDSRPCAG